MASRSYFNKKPPSAAPRPPETKLCPPEVILIKKQPSAAPRPPRPMRLISILKNLGFPKKYYGKILKHYVKIKINIKKKMEKF